MRLDSPTSISSLVFRVPTLPGSLIAGCDDSVIDVLSFRAFLDAYVNDSEQLGTARTTSAISKSELMGP
jgi:hypothetical protein